jgi:hypothetical protein
VLYTTDQKAVENDEIFVEFVTGSHDAFVIEDALVRPGRAFGVLRTRLHTREEALLLMRRLAGERFDEGGMERGLPAYPRGI